jgi:aspartyl/asparaginyl-tRNA synthetase
VKIKSGWILQFKFSLKQQKVIIVEGAVQFSGITQQPVQLHPEPLTVIFNAGVNQFVQNGVIA